MSESRVARSRRRRVPTEGVDGLAFLCGTAVGMAYVTLAVEMVGPGRFLRLLEALVLLAATMTQASYRLQRCVGDRKRAALARRLARRLGPAAAIAFALLTGFSLAGDVNAGRDWRFGAAAFGCGVPALCLTLCLTLWNAVRGRRKRGSENFRAEVGQVR